MTEVLVQATEVEGWTSVTGTVQGREDLLAVARAMTRISTDVRLYSAADDHGLSSPVVATLLDLDPRSARRLVCPGPEPLLCTSARTWLHLEAQVRVGGAATPTWVRSRSLPRRPVAHCGCEPIGSSNRGRHHAG